MKIVTKLSLIAFAVMATCSTAFATDTYTLTLVDPLPSVTGSVWTGVNWESVYIGPLNINVKLNGVSLGNTTMYCVDLQGAIYKNTSWTAIINTGEKPDGVVSSDAWDMAAWLAEKNTGWSTGSYSADKGAGLQIAIWEVISDYNKSAADGNWSLSNGNFRLSGAANAASEAWNFFSSAESAGVPTGYAANQQWYEAVTSGQDQIFFIPNYGPPPSVPEIPAMALAPLGIATMGFIKRKFAK